MKKDCKKIKLGADAVGEGHPVFIIAEIGVNHNGDMSMARKMIDEAKKLGADAVKFQSYKTEEIITKEAPSAEYHIKATGGRESWMELLKKLELSEKAHVELKQYCEKAGIIFLSTPYDRESALFLNGLGVEAFKIASTDANNLPLLKLIASFKKPVLLSTGMSTIEEIDESVKFLTSEGNDSIVLLQCTSNYPPKIEDLNINVIGTLKERFGLPVGFSDHSALREAAIAAVAKGACVYEAHFTLDRSLPGPDQTSSMDPKQFRDVVNEIKLTEKILGSAVKSITGSEKETRMKMRKSVVARRPISKGERFSESNLAIKRPGTGLPPKYYFEIVGKTAKNDIQSEGFLKNGDY